MLKVHNSQYTKAQKYHNLFATDSFFNLIIIELEIFIEYEQLKIIGYNCFASVDTL